jgi:hypothetical protein
MNGGAMSPIFNPVLEVQAILGAAGASVRSFLVGGRSGSIRLGFASADLAFVEVEENHNGERNFFSGAKPFRK